MGVKNRKQTIIGGLAAITLLVILAVPAFTGRPGGSTGTQVTAQLVETCPEGICATNAGGWDPVSAFESAIPHTDTYSLLPDSLSVPSYEPVPLLLQSEFLTHGTVYTLDTTDSSRTLKLHFYTPAGNPPPSCWGAALADVYTDNDSRTYTTYSMDVTQGVNWSIFSENSVAFAEMTVDSSGAITYPGFARLDFNVRNEECDRNIYRFYLKWALPNRKTGGGAGIQIARTAEDRWEITTDEAGTASLFGQGGRKGETESYGDFRMPFKIILTTIS